MINGIGSSSSYFSSLFATNGANGTNSTSASSGATQLAQTEEKLFASIDTNGDGSISQGEFSTVTVAARRSSRSLCSNIRLPGRRRSRRPPRSVPAPE
jgi:hypothetical protein